MELTSTSNRIIGSLLAMALPFAAGPVAAQEQPAVEAALEMELDGLAQVETSCRSTFVVRNGLPHDLTKVVFEFALFNTSGLVERLLTLDFKDLPEGRTRVRQFDLTDLQCGDLARVLVNDARECSGDGVEPGACMRDLRTTTATDLEFGS
jgi:hypothetical protein